MPSVFFLAGEAGGGLSAINTGIAELLSIATTILNAILANPVLALLFAGGFATVAIGLISQLKHA